MVYDGRGRREGEKWRERENREWAAQRGAPARISKEKEREKESRSKRNETKSGRTLRENTAQRWFLLRPSNNTGMEQNGGERCLPKGENYPKARDCMLRKHAGRSIRRKHRFARTIQREREREGDRKKRRVKKKRKGERGKRSRDCERWFRLVRNSRGRRVLRRLSTRLRRANRELAIKMCLCEIILVCRFAMPQI